MKRLIAIAALILVGVVGGKGAAIGPPFFMARLEFAGDAATLQALIANTKGVSVTLVRSALEWDYLFLISYGLLIATAAASLGRRLGGRWEYAGAIASLSGLVAAVLDAVENAALLHALEGRPGAAIAAAAAGLKFSLAVGGVLFVIVAAIAALVQRLRKQSDQPLPRPADRALAAVDLTCDVVMKGGITSGIVYPRAVGRLAEKYRFVNLGGASAGAIAASATAAAEYARANGRDGFAVLEQLPAWLGQGGRLFNLFRPNPSTRAPFEAFVAFLGNIPLPFKLARAFATTAWHFPIAFVLGVLPGGLLAWGAFSTSTPAWGVTGGVALSLIFAPLALIVGLIANVLFALPKNGFGMCSGRLDGEVVLSDWLTNLLNDLAGVTGRPLIFADLWTAGESLTDVEAIRQAARGRRASDRKINFEALTTSLAHGRPYRMPEIGRTFFFRREELERVLPESVVQWMVDHHGSSDEVVPPGYLPLPEPHDLPVVFAARLSLSFPFLISAVPLWGIDWSRRANRERATGAPAQLDVCWMSDGGIASNFPIHFFDALVPSRPTFGLDLAPFSVDAKRDADEAKNVFLPDNNREGFTESWLHFSGVGGFVGGLVNSIQAFLDNMQARAPGFRDRIARIHLDSEEGGLNLAMPADVLARLGARGEAAGNKIIERFIEAKPSGWENHRWVRLRLLLGQLDPLLRHLAKQMNGATLPAQPPSYRWKAGQHQLAERLVADLVNVGNRLATSSIDLEEGAPRPFSELRGRPRV